MKVSLRACANVVASTADRPTSAARTKETVWFIERREKLRGSGRTARPGGTSHPEDAELHVGNRRVEAGRQAQRQHAARVGGVDHAVVPQARAGEIRVALRLVL